MLRSRSSVLGWVLVYTAGRAALQRALPVYLGIVMGALVVFGRNGLRPQTVVAEAGRSTALRLVLYAAWVVATLPAVRALLATETTFFLRTLPVRRRDMLSILTCMIVLVELPWTLLWWKGGGPIAGAAATVAAVAASTLLLTGLRRLGHLAALGALVGILGSMRSQAALLLAFGLPSAAFAVSFVWRRAPEISRVGSRAWVRGPSLVALTLAYLAVLFRRAAAQIIRAFGFVFLAGGAGYLVVKNQADVTSWLDAETLTLVTAVPGFAFGLSGLAGPLLRTEGQLEWLIAVSGTSRRTRRLAVFFACASIAVALAFAHAFAMSSALRASAPQTRSLLVHDLESALVITASILAIARWALQGSGHDAIRLIAGVGALVLGICASLNAFQASALVGWAILAMLSLPWGSRSKRRTEGSHAAVIQGEAMLEMVDVTKRLRGRNVLDRVTLRCGPGEIGVVLGENGAGKSTLLRIASGMIEPDAGQVSIRGHLLTGGGLEARRHLGYVPDATDALPDLLVAEFVHLVCSLKHVPIDGGDALFAWREKLGLGGVWSQRFSSLSFGQRKRACLLAALVGDPWLLLLDEPSNGLDPEGVALMRRLLVERQSQGKAALLASNDLPFVHALHTKPYRLEGGKLSAMLPQGGPPRPEDDEIERAGAPRDDQRGAQSP